MIKYKNILFILFVLVAFGQAQTLTVSLGNNNHADSYEDPNGSNVVMTQIELSAAGGDIEVTSITVDPITGNGANGVRRGKIVEPEILIYEDSDNNGVLDVSVDEFIASTNYSGGATANLTDETLSINNKEILNGETQNWIIVHNFDDVGDGRYLDIDITAMSSTGTVNGLPIGGNRRTFETTVGSENVALFVSEGGNNPINRNVGTSATNEVMFQMLIATSTFDTVSVSQIDFDMSGTGDDGNDITNAKLYHDVDGNGVLNLEQDVQIGSTVTSASLSNDGILSFTSLSEEINAGEYEHWIIVYNFSGSASNGETFIIDLTTNGDISATELNANGVDKSGAPVNSATATISATGSLTLSLGSSSPGSTSISATESGLEMIQINLAANATENIEVTAVSFDASGTGNESTDLDSVIFYKDVNGNGIYDILYDLQMGSTVTSFTDDGLIVFNITDTVLAGLSNDYGLLYWLNGNAATDETFKVFFDATSQITASGLTSLNSILPLGLPVNGSTMTISATGTITIAMAETNPGPENYEGTATNITMLAFTMAANDVEDIDIESIRVFPSTNDILRESIENVEIKIYEDVDENGILDLATDRFIASENYTAVGNNDAREDRIPDSNRVNITGETIAANSSVQWLIINSITGGSVGDYLSVSVSSSDIFGTGQTSSGKANVSGSSLFGGAKTHVTGIPGSITLGAGPQNPGYHFIAPGAQNESMVQFQLTADAIEDIEISQIGVILSGTGNESNDVDSVRLFLDGDNNGSLNLLNDTQLGSTVTSLVNNDTLTFSSFSDTLLSGSASNYIIVHNYNSDNNVVGETFQVTTGTAYITATGINTTSTIVPTGSSVNGGLVTITDTGTLTVSAGSNNPGATNVANNDPNVVTVQFNITAGSNEAVTITSISFSMTGTFDDTLDFIGGSFELYNDDNGNGSLDGGETQIGTGQSPNDDNGTVTFSGISETILTSSNENWIVLCDLNGAASNFENFRVSFSNSSHITATGDDTDNTIFPDGVPAQGGLFTVASTGSLSLTKGSNNPGASIEVTDAQIVEMFQLKFTASGVEDIDITSITFTADGTGDDLADLNDAGNGVSLYLDANNDGIVDGGDSVIGAESAFSANDGTITFTLTETITASSSENWLVVYDLDGTASNGETFRLGIYMATEITATGVSSSNPIIPSGFPVVGNYKTIGAALGSLTLFAGDFNPGVSIITDQLDFEMLQFKLTVSTTEDIAIDELTITHLGTADPENDLLTNGVQLVRDVNNNGTYDGGTDLIISSTDFSGTTATFTFADTIQVDSTEIWLIMYDYQVAQTNGETFQTRINSLTDISLTGVTSGNPITAEGSVPIYGGTKTYDSDNPLPVELTSFIAEGDYGHISLIWQTQSEINNLGFDIQRKLSTDEEFSIIASYREFDELSGQGTISYATEYEFKDVTVIPELEYSYKLIQNDYSGNVNIESIVASATAKVLLPTKYELKQNYPNPFNPQTIIGFKLPYIAEIKLVVYNVLGQEVITLKEETLEAGNYSVKWNARNNLGQTVSSGTYFYVLNARNLKTKKNHSVFKKMVLLK